MIKIFKALGYLRLWLCRAMTRSHFVSACHGAEEVMHSGDFKPQNLNGHKLPFYSCVVSENRKQAY
jgi:hypothetical protein